MTIYSLDIPFAQFGTSLCSMSSSNYCFLTHIQVSQEASKVVWYAHLFENFPQFIVINIVKDFSEVNEAEVDVLLDLLCFLHDPVNVGNLISGFSASSKPSLYIWKFMVHILLKLGLENVEHFLASVWDDCNFKFLLNQKPQALRLKDYFVIYLSFASSSYIECNSIV